METICRRAPRPGRAALPLAFARAALLVLALTPARSASASPAGEAISHGDAAYARGDLATAQTDYAEALRLAPGHYPALWKLARVESELGEDVSGDGQRRLVIAAVEHARGAIKAAPDSAQGHVWLAVALGRQALKEGPRTRLALSREIKSEVDHAIGIDPGIGRAYHVRGIWNRKVASLNFMERAAANSVLGGVPKGASMENAIRDLQKAIELEPNYVNHHLELGRTLADLKRWDESRRELERAVALPPTSNPRDPHYQAEAREMLSKLSRH